MNYAGISKCQSVASDKSMNITSDQTLGIVGKTVAVRATDGAGYFYIYNASATDKITGLDLWNRVKLPEYTGSNSEKVIWLECGSGGDWVGWKKFTIKYGMIKNIQ